MNRTPHPCQRRQAHRSTLATKKAIEWTVARQLAASKALGELLPDTVWVIRIRLHTTIVKYEIKYSRPEIEYVSRIAPHTFVDSIVANTGIARYAKTAATLTDRQCKAVAGSSERVMTGCTGDVAVAAQDLVEEELGTEGDLGRVR